METLGRGNSMYSSMWNLFMSGPLAMNGLYTCIFLETIVEAKSESLSASEASLGEGP